MTDEGSALTGWPAAERLVTSRLVLEPLRVEHAAELGPVFDDPTLHEFIGGSPRSVDELAELYAFQVAGPEGRPAERWYNWVVREQASAAALGTVQATVFGGRESVTADVAWVIATAFQRQGYAREAATAMVAWLRRAGADVVSANVHPEHQASMAVARALRLTATDELVDGEVRWVG
jgi:RimJ/RimL family protein N-acetyltransferase